MAEIIRIGYKRLFEVRILHHYFLDDGAEDFSGPFNTQDDAVKAKKRTERDRRIARYDIRKVLKVAPIPATVEQIRQLNGVFRQTAFGFIVAVPPATVVPANARFDFAVTVEDGNFFQYTALPFFKNKPNESARDQKIVELIVDKKVYRYKPNVFVFSNENGTTRTLTGLQVGPTNTPQKRFYLSKEIPDFVPNTALLAEYLVKKDNALFRAMNDQPQPQPVLNIGMQSSTNWHELTLPIPPPIEPAFTFNRLPAYVNQEDIPSITPLPGAVGTPPKGILLTEDLPDGIIALIKMETTPVLPPAIAPDFQLLSGGQLRNPHPVFDLHFKNRSTFWRYYNKNNSRFEELPFSFPRALTAFGNSALNSNANNGNQNAKKPSPLFVNIQTSPAGNLTKLYSDII